MIALMSAPDVGLPLGAPHCHSWPALTPRFGESQLTEAVVRLLSSILLVAVVKVPGSADNSPRNLCCGSSFAVLCMNMLIHAEFIVAPDGIETVVQRKPSCSSVLSTSMKALESATALVTSCHASSLPVPTCSSIVVSISMG